MSIPTSGFYNTVLNSFFGGLSAAQQQALWTEFLQQNNYTTNPSDTDAVAEAAFVQFIEGQYSQTNATTTLSPDEIAKRYVVFNTFTIILQMLTMLQKTVAQQTAHLNFLQKYQEQYTELMGAMPTYIASPDTQWTTSLEPSKFTFGYNNISAQDIANYVAFSGNSYTVQGIVNPFADPLLGITPLQPISIQFSDSEVSFTIGTLITFSEAVAPVPSTVSPGDQAQFLADNIAGAFDRLMATTYSNGTLMSFINDQLRSQTTIPWRFISPYPIDPDSNLSQEDQQKHSQINTNYSKARAEVNTRDQAWLQTAQGERQILQDRAQVVNTNLSSIKEALNQQANVMNSLVESLRSIVAAITK